MLTLTVSREFAGTGPANSEGDYSEADTNYSLSCGENQQFASSDRVKNALGFSASSLSLSSSSNLARTTELPAWDEFDFPFQLVKHKCKGKKLTIEEKPGYETKTSRFV